MCRFQAGGYADVAQTAALKTTADSLNQFSKGLRWIDETSLGWIAKPLKRTASALMKLTPAEMDEPEAGCRDLGRGRWTVRGVNRPPQRGPIRRFWPTAGRFRRRATGPRVAELFAFPRPLPWSASVHPPACCSSTRDALSAAISRGDPLPSVARFSR